MQAYVSTHRGGVCHFEKSEKGTLPWDGSADVHLQRKFNLPIMVQIPCLALDAVLHLVYPVTCRCCSATVVAIEAQDRIHTMID